MMAQSDILEAVCVVPQQRRAAENAGPGSGHQGMDGLAPQELEEKG